MVHKFTSFSHRTRSFPPQASHTTFQSSSLAPGISSLTILIKSAVISLLTLCFIRLFVLGEREETDAGRKHVLLLERLLRSEWGGDMKHSSPLPVSWLWQLCSKFAPPRWAFQSRSHFCHPALFLWSSRTFSSSLEEATWKKDSLTFPQKVTRGMPVWPRNSTLGIEWNRKRIENIHLCKNLCTNIHSS